MHAGTPVWDKLKQGPKFQHVKRWHDFIGGQQPMCDVAQQHNVKRRRVVPPKDASTTGQGAPAAGGASCVWSRRDSPVVVLPHSVAISGAVMAALAGGSAVQLMPAPLAACVSYALHAL